MQINSASLLAAQQQSQVQQKPRASAFGAHLNAPSTKPAEAAPATFEPADFAKTEAPQTSAASARNPAQAFRLPGSALDIRV